MRIAPRHMAALTLAPPLDAITALAAERGNGREISLKAKKRHRPHRDWRGASGGVRNAPSAHQLAAILAQARLFYAKARIRG